MVTMHGGPVTCTRSPVNAAPAPSVLAVTRTSLRVTGVPDDLSVCVTVPDSVSAPAASIAPITSPPSLKKIESSASCTVPVTRVLR